MQQQIRTQTPKKNKPAASLIISWLIILGVYLLLRLVFVIFGFHLAPVILGGCLAVILSYCFPHFRFTLMIHLKLFNRSIVN